MTPWTLAHLTPLYMGILQERILEWVVMPSSRGSSQFRDLTQVSRISGRFFTIWATREAQELEWVSYFFSSGSSQPRHSTEVSSTTGRFFTSWATREVIKRLFLFKNMTVLFRNVFYVLCDWLSYSYSFLLAFSIILSFLLALFVIGTYLQQIFLSFSFLRNFPYKGY